MLKLNICFSQVCMKKNFPCLKQRLNKKLYVHFLYISCIILWHGIIQQSRPEIIDQVCFCSSHRFRYILWRKWRVVHGEAENILETWKQMSYLCSLRRYTAVPKNDLTLSFTFSISTTIISMMMMM